jgi:hypothetical protein
MNEECVTGRCRDHRIDLLTANTEYYADVQMYKFKYYCAIVIGLMSIGLVVLFKDLL